MEIVAVPVLEDNYAYLLIDRQSNIAAAVDPAEPEKVIAAAEKLNVKLTSILTTHHHWDHADGNAELQRRLGGPSSIRVYGGDDRIQALSHKVGHDDVIEVGGLKIRVIFTPCHTTGHVLYYIDGSGDESPVVFTGDTLFIGGCGRFFEGTAQQMYDALYTHAGSLPDNTRVYCGHEYTVSNLRFAAKVDASNAAVLSKLQWAEEVRERGEPTIPSTIGEEKQFNPFMRVHTSAIRSAVNLADDADAIRVMQALRDLKNRG